MDVVAVLLAAGESERMGTSKALLSWRGNTLLSHQLNEIQKSRISECVVVLGRDSGRLSPMVRRPLHPTWKARAIYNPRYTEGKSTSIRAGLTSLFTRPDGVLVAAVDQPLDHRLLDVLLERGEEEWERADPLRRTILVPVFRGKRGHPSLFSGSLMGELMGVSEEKQGLRAVVRRTTERVLEIPWESSDVLLNLNVPADMPIQTGVAGREAR